MGTTVNRGYPYPSPYTDPQDVRQAIEDLALAVDSDLQSIHAAITSAIEAPTVSLSNETPQSVPVGTAGLDLSWAVELYDNAGMHGGIPDQIEFTSNGIYLVSAWVGWNATGDATIRDMELSILTDGAAGPVPASRTARLDQVAPTTFAITFPYPVITAGETLKVHVVHDDDAALDVISARLNVTRMGSLDPL